MQYLNLRKRVETLPLNIGDAVVSKHSLKISLNQPVPRQTNGTVVAAKNTPFFGWQYTVDFLMPDQTVNRMRGLTENEIQPSRQPAGSLDALLHDAHTGTKSWDVFISHASEDKEDVALPLAQFLRSSSLSVWLDVVELNIGDSLRRKIDEGLANSRFAVVILSRSFLAKHWPQYELDGLVTRQISGQQVLLPIWHQITLEEVRHFSPSLADKVARNTAQLTISQIGSEIVNVIRRAY